MRWYTQEEEEKEEVGSFTRDERGSERSRKHEKCILKTWNKTHVKNAIKAKMEKNMREKNQGKM